MNRSNGFTLIEVLVVVAIIALLLAILMPSMSRARQQSISATCLSNQHQIGIALTTYANHNMGFLPPQNTNLIEWVPNPTRLAFEKELGRNNYHKVLFCPNDDIMRDPDVEKRPPWPPGNAYGTTRVPHRGTTIWATRRGVIPRTPWMPRRRQTRCGWTSTATERTETSTSARSMKRTRSKWW